VLEAESKADRETDRDRGGYQIGECDVTREHRLGTKLAPAGVAEVGSEPDAVEDFGRTDKAVPYLDVMMDAARGDIIGRTEVRSSSSTSSAVSNMSVLATQSTRCQSDSDSDSDSDRDRDSDKAAVSEVVDRNNDEKQADEEAEHGLFDETVSAIAVAASSSASITLAAAMSHIERTRKFSALSL
jgi:hypothetical protein